MLAPVGQYECYFASTGGAAPMTLPTSYNASFPSEGSPAGPGLQQQVMPLTWGGFPNLLSSIQIQGAPESTVHLRGSAAWCPAPRGDCQAREIFGGEMKLKGHTMMTISRIYTHAAVTSLALAAEVPDDLAQGPGWMRSFGQPGRPGGQGATLSGSTAGAGASAQAAGQSGSFLGSLGIATQPPAQTGFKGKAHTLGNLPQCICI